MTNKINKLAKLIDYYDFYKLLLTKKQQQLFEFYYFEDFSLTEIATVLDINRNSVYDILKRAEKNLLFFEEKLKLSEKNRQLLNLISQIKEQKLQTDFFDLLKKY
ncbi:MAG: hypothetical protein HPPSJP_4340 [Candidatus Hepatoplasma scabrum]|nr:MAG: hypothetical protein HPPSJP_4340 [Candidatus Hepatoplasma sp.]